MDNENKNIALRISYVTIAGNILLTGYKIFAGIFAHSSAMISDAVHSLSDVLSTLVVIIGVKMAGKSSDNEHPFGHERFECVAAIILSAILFATGAGIGWSGAQKLFSENRAELEVPGLAALIAALVSIAVKEAMYWYTFAGAKKTGSSALMAGAWHHRSDALSSVGSFAGILGARLGLPILDPAACIIICVFILKAAVDIFRDAINKMTDKACDEETISEMRGVILSQDKVEGIDQLKTRLFGDKIYVEVEILTDGSETLERSHHTAQHVHDAIERRFPKVKHCMVHVNPVNNTEETEY